MATTKEDVLEFISNMSVLELSELVKEFEEKFGVSAQANKDNFSIKSGVIESKLADLATIEAMAKLPGRDELLGMLLNVWNAPVQNFTIGLQALADKLSEEE